MRSRTSVMALRMRTRADGNNKQNKNASTSVKMISGYRFQDQGGIYIGDNALIGHNAVLATLNHDQIPEKRENLIPAPIHIGNKVWLGANVTVCPGVTIGDGAIVAAGRLFYLRLISLKWLFLHAMIPSRCILPSSLDIFVRSRLR